MEKQRINNFIRLTASEGGKRYRVLTDEAGNELGIEVSGVLTTAPVFPRSGTIIVHCTPLACKSRRLDGFDSLLHGKLYQK